jgi:hypothetical protein
LKEDPFVFGFDFDSDPLYLKQGCPLIEAGAGYIDEYPYLLGKFSCIYVVPGTNNFHGIPDTNMANIGCHYFDWNYAYAPLKSDLYRDKIVNFVDFAFLAAAWLKIYDMNNLNTMANEWLEIAEPNIQLNISGDANNGFAEVGADGYSSDTQRIFLCVDGQYAGEMSGFRGGWPLGIDVSKLGGGERKLKTVGINRSREVTCSNLTSTEFACPLNYLLLPDTYEPNKPLHFSAFNPSTGDVTVNVYADCGNLVWSQTYSGNSFWGTIPAEITDQNEIDYVSFDKGDECSIGKMSTAADTTGTSSGNIRALIILPDPELTWLDIDTTMAVQKAFTDRGIVFQRLGPGSATYENIKDYVQNNPIKYLYIRAHGHYKADNDKDSIVLRTHVVLNGDVVYSVKKSDFPPGQAPSWCESLGRFRDDPNYPDLTKTFYSMGFTNMNVKFAYFDCCLSGRLKINANNELIEGQSGPVGLFDLPQSDMSFALGMDEPSCSHLYQCWYDKSKVKFRRKDPETWYQKWSRNEWEKLGEGDNIEEAVIYAIGQQTNLEDPNAPVNTFRFKGQWIDTIRLVGN